MKEFKRNLLLRKNLKSTILGNREVGSVRSIFWRGNYVVFEKMLSIMN